MDGFNVQSSTVNLSKKLPVKSKVLVGPSGSQSVISWLIRRVIVPPYCGWPRLSHQFPPAEVVVDFVEVGAVLAVVIGGEVVLIVFVVVAGAVGSRRRRNSVLQDARDK